MMNTSHRWIAPWLAPTLVVALTTACSAPPVEEATSVPAPATPPIEVEAQIPEVGPVTADLIPNGLQINDELLVGGQPSPAQLQVLAELGYRTVINLRGENEEGSTDPVVANDLGLSLLQIPITSADDLSIETSRALAEALAAVEGPVVVHCRSGNRVGALFALRAYHLDGLAPEDAFQLGLDHGMTKLAPIMRGLLGIEVDEQTEETEVAEDAA